MLELLFAILDGLDTGLWALKDDPQGCFGCLFKAIGILIGIVTAVFALFLGISWLISLF